MTRLLTIAVNFCLMQVTITPTTTTAFPVEPSLFVTALLIAVVAGLRSKHWNRAAARGRCWVLATLSACVIALQRKPFASTHSLTQTGMAVSDKSLIIRTKYLSPFTDLTTNKSAQAYLKDGTLSRSANVAAISRSPSHSTNLLPTGWPSCPQNTTPWNIEKHVYIAQKILCKINMCIGGAWATGTHSQSNAQIH